MKTFDQNPSSNLPSENNPSSASPEANAINRFPLTDTGNAELLAKLNRDKICYDHGRQKWLLWKEHWWSKEANAEVMRMAKNLARVRARFVNEIEDEDIRKKAKKFAHQSESHARIKSFLELAKSEPLISQSGDGWDTNQMLMGVANGVVDLRSGKLRAGRPVDRITLHSDIFFDSDSKCPRWEQFLNEIFDGNNDLIEFLHRAVGYSLTGDVSEQVLFLCYGTGANGKSTFLEVIKHVLGDYAFNLPFSAFELKSRQSIPNDVAAIEGKRFVTALETDEAAQLNEARIKSLTGGDPITARLLYHEYRTFLPTFKIWLAFNHKPNVNDDSHGFWRRVKLIPFEKRFETEAADPRLIDKLKAEAPGILAWAVRGCLAWRRLGLGTPTVVTQATTEYRAESDPLSQFLEETCQTGADLKVGSTELFEKYRSWATVNSERSLERWRFRQMMKDKGFVVRPYGHDHVYTWIGLALRPDPPQRADASADSLLLVI
jgi:putative DNA primase/helicase